MLNHIIEKQGGKEKRIKRINELIKNLKNIPIKQNKGNLKKIIIK